MDTLGSLDDLTKCHHERFGATEFGAVTFVNTYTDPQISKMPLYP